MAFIIYTFLLYIFYFYQSLNEEFITNLVNGVEK